MYKHLILLAVTMGAVVAASNYLVAFPVHAHIGRVSLADLLTWGAFTYPFAFVVTDVANRLYGAQTARYIVMVGFILALFLSALLFNPRIAIASGTAFFTAQFLDIFIFDKLRDGIWWRAPLISSLLASVVDTTLFFSLAFAESFAHLGAGDGFAVEMRWILGIVPVSAPRWVSWGLGDLAVKLIVAVVALGVYRIVLDLARPGWRRNPTI